MPFGPYKDFDDCVAKNRDKGNPEAYCASLHHQITGKWPGEEGRDSMRRAGQASPDVLGTTLLEASDVQVIEATEGKGARIRTTLIRAGWSKNKHGEYQRYYPKETLQRAASHWEGAQMFLDHERSFDDLFFGRSVKDLAGYYENVAYEEDAVGPRLVADLVPLDTEAGRLAMQLAREVVKHQRPFAGLSIAARAKMRKGEVEGKKAMIVDEIFADPKPRCDMVTLPAAGGSVDEVSEEVEIDVRVKLTKEQIDAILAKNPELAPILEAMRSNTATDGTTGGVDEVAKLREQNLALLREKAMLQRSAIIKEALDATKPALPEHSKERIKAVVEAKGFICCEGKLDEAGLKAALAAEIKAENEYLGKLVNKGMVTIGSGADTTDRGATNFEKRYMAMVAEIMEYPSTEIDNEGYTAEERKWLSEQAARGRKMMALVDHEVA